MINKEIIELFNTYSDANKKQEIISLLSGYLNHGNELTEEEKCWVFWNISDNLAMLRNADCELLNHKEFEKQLSYMDSKYLHWIVSDATQKLTLIVGGYERYWNELYKYACNNCPKLKENSIIRFESHRANIPIPISIEYQADKEHAIFSIENLRKSWEELKGSSNEKFYALTYYTQVIACFNFLNENFKSFLDNANESFEDILPLLKTEKQSSYIDGTSPLLGSWEQLNKPRSQYNQATCAIHNYIIQLINNGLFWTVQDYDKAANEL